MRAHLNYAVLPKVPSLYPENSRKVAYNYATFEKISRKNFWGLYKSRKPCYNKAEHICEKRRAMATIEKRNNSYRFIVSCCRAPLPGMRACCRGSTPRSVTSSSAKFSRRICARSTPILPRTASGSTPNTPATSALTIICAKMS